jgi:hypothetical protein
MMLHQPAGGSRGVAADSNSGARILRCRPLECLLAEHTGQSQERITQDSDRDFWIAPTKPLARWSIPCSVTQTARQAVGHASHDGGEKSVVSKQRCPDLWAPEVSEWRTIIAAGATIQQTAVLPFCGKSQHEVRKLIAGPSVFICDECVSVQ